ncbi:MAG TPA: hypothetical protein VGB85_19860, partial [Nannocystis sp.]
PGPAHAEIHAHNPEMTLETMTSAAAALAPLAAVAGGRPGAMTPARWQLLADQLAELGVIAPGSVDPTGAFTTAFLPGV